MILTVGPGTPAVLVDLSSSSSEEEEEEEEDQHPTRADSSRSSSFSEQDEEQQQEEEEEEAEEASMMGEDHANDEEEGEGDAVCPAASTSGGGGGGGGGSSTPTTTATTTSNSSTKNIKRTLSDRMKITHDDHKDDLDDDGGGGARQDAEKLQDDTNDDDKDEMEGLSSNDVEREQGMEEDDDDEGEEPHQDDSWIDGNRDYWEENHQAEEHRMQFSFCGDEDEEDTPEEDANHSESSPPRRNLRRMWERTGNDDDDDDDDEVDEDQMAAYRELAAEWLAMEQASVEDDEDSDDDDDEDSDEDLETRVIIRRRYLRRSSSPRRNSNQPRTMKTSIRHQGCINTAAWLESGWRLSTVSNHFYASTSYNANNDDVFCCRPLTSDDCPTQLVTSGDDREVKFWDVRYAMGGANPLPWGRNTHCPFASPGESSNDTGYKAKWNDFYRRQKPVEPWKISGNIMPLISMHTGHLRNVFHVTPLWQQPGKVATCGADGYLRLGDVEASSNGDSSSSAIIISPEHSNSSLMGGLFQLGAPICFSHHFLNSNVGLLCTERGLRKFDIRLPPRQQERRPLVGGLDACKACAIWTSGSSSSVEEVDSAYVFGKPRCFFFLDFACFNISHKYAHNAFITLSWRFWCGCQFV